MWQSLVECIASPTSPPYVGEQLMALFHIIITTV